MLLTALPALVYIGLVVYSVLDCLQTPGDELNRLARGPWLAVVLLVPLGGALAWLAVGKVGRGRHERVRSGPNRVDGYGWTAEGAAGHPVGPDDDQEFMAGLVREAQQRRRDRDRRDPDGV